MIGMTKAEAAIAGLRKRLKYSRQYVDVQISSWNTPLTLHQHNTLKRMVQYTANQNTV